MKSNVRKLAHICAVTAFSMGALTTHADQNGGNATASSTSNFGASSTGVRTVAVGPIKDSSGRIRYIVDLVDDAAGRPATFPNADSKIAYYKEKSAQLIAEVSKLRTDELFSTTSLVGTSFTAYLTEDQVAALSKDQRVKLITQDAYQKPSGVWNRTTGYGNEVFEWGLYALDVASSRSSNGFATVYILDTGVEMHADLPGLASADRISALSGINPTGCYAHGTHVAGIVGAGANYTGVVGVLPGVRIVSIAIGDVNTTNPVSGVPCSDGYPISGIVAALEYVRQKVILDNKVGIVNLSYNRGSQNSSNAFSATGTVGLKMKSVATPTFEDGVGYRGALIVESAGNYNNGNCLDSYDSPSGYDGILVAGALDNNGQAVVPLSGIGLGFANVPFADDEPGSNTGNCVEVWAPGQRIKSTWTGGYQLLSGTSMAAPHITGFAARLLESDPYINTSADLEAAVRGYFVTIGGSNLAMPRLSLQAVTAAPTVEFTEGGGLRSSVSPINFNKYAGVVDLKFAAVGASVCSMDVTKNGGYFSSQYFYPPIANTFSTNSLLGGNYVWTATCYSPQSTYTQAVASGHIKLVIEPKWEVKTTSNNYTWTVIPNGGLVNWAISGGTFDQRNIGDGADSCQLRSYGFTGNIVNDIDHPSYYMGGSSQLPIFQQSDPPLWDSQPGFPAYYEHATFTFGDTRALSTPYDGYKWLLTCTNADETRSTVMYGKPQ